MDSYLRRSILWRGIASILSELSERICAVEFNNQNLLKSYDRLTDMVSLQEINMYAIKIMFTNETLSLLNKFHTLESSMRALEQNTGQEIQTLQKSVVRRFVKSDEIIRTDEQGEKVQGQNLA